MPKQTKICRVCGAAYEACNSVRSGSGVFNWREVACSPQCGMVYLKKVTDSRRGFEEAHTPPAIRRRKSERPEPHDTVETVPVETSAAGFGSMEASE